MMNEDLLILARLRLNRAKETLSEARLLLEAGYLNGAITDISEIENVIRDATH